MIITVRKPREAWQWAPGNWVIHVNWSISWDGWCVTKDELITWKAFTIEPWKNDIAKGLNITIWRLVLRVGRID